MTNELTVRVQNSVIPAMSWNKDEVQQNLDELLAAYTGLVYTPESIKGAKDDRAKINSWDKQLVAAVKEALPEAVGGLSGRHQDHAGAVQKGLRRDRRAG